MYRIGVDLGGTNIKAGIINSENRLIAKASVPTLKQRESNAVLSDIVNLVQSLIATQNLSPDQICGVGIGCPGIIDAKNGIVVYSNNIEWENIEIRNILQNQLKCKVCVSNDANCAALGEQIAGAAMNYQNVILLTLGTGVGSGIIIDGHIFEGGHAGGAELGHTLLYSGGEHCTCGRDGCVEAYVSASALIRDVKRAVSTNPASKILEYCNHDVNQIDGKTVFLAAAAQDTLANKIVLQYIQNLGDAIVSFTNTFRPDIVLLGGGICEQGSLITDPLNLYVKNQCFGKEKSYTPAISCASLGNQAGIIGAASLVNN